MIKKYCIQLPAVLFLLLAGVGYSYGQCQLPKSVISVLERGDRAEMHNFLPLIRQCPDYSDSLAQLYHALGVKAYSQVGLDTAILYMREAQSIRASLFDDSPNMDLGKSSHNLGFFLNSIRDYRSALPPLHTAVRTYEYLDEADRLARSQLQLAQAYNGIGAFEEALTYLDIVILNSRERESDKYLADAQLDKGLLFLNRGEYAKALPELQAADAIYTRYDLSSSGANTILNLALTYDGLGDLSFAERYFQEAIQHYETLEDDVYLAITQNNLGLVYVENDRLAEAYNMIQQGLESARRSGVKSIEAQALDHLGEYYLAMGKPRKAETNFQHAQGRLLVDYYPDAPLMLPDTSALAFMPNQLDMLIYLSDQAKALSQWYEQSQEEQVLYKALQAYSIGNTLIGYIRQGHQNQATKLFWRKEVLPFYESAIRLCYKAGRGEESFRLFEQSKSILLLEALLENDAMRLIPDSLQSMENQLKRSLSSIYESLPDLDEEKQKQAYQQILNTQSELQGLQHQLQKAYPRYQELTQAPAIPSLQDFRASIAIAKDQVLIHYFFGEKEVYALVVDDQSSETYFIGEAQEVRQKTGEVLAYFTDATQIENAPQAYVQTAYDLYAQIIAPLLIPAGKRLLVIPDGPLTYLPFSALTTSSDYSGNMNDISFLIRQYPLSYAHSAGILAQQTKHHSGHVNEILAFAPFADGTAPVGYAKLGYSQDELQQISTQYQCSLYQNEQASLLNWQENAANGGILHLSTHAFSSPLEQSPHIAFYDSLLYLRELYLQRIVADLVVLSACQTNIGPLAPGEGVLGLGRGFVQAGAGSIIASLWNVNARSTGSILATFYEQLANKQTKPLALHAAQLQYLNRTDIPHYQKSPYYWAGLTYYGDDQTLVIKSKRNWKAYISIGLIVLISLVLGSLWWKRRG